MTYSQDLRERAIAEIERGEESHADIAERFQVNKSTLDKWWYRWQATGSCAALPHHSGPDRTLQSCDTFIRAEIKKQPDASLADLCERVQAHHNLSASVSMMCRELQILKLPRKKSRSRIATLDSAGRAIAKRICHALCAGVG